MKWIGTFFIGYVLLLAGGLAALLKMGVLDRIGTAWSIIAVVMLLGVGVMISVSRSGAKENIEIDRK